MRFPPPSGFGFLLALAAAFAGAEAVASPAPRAVVELFTSQGCSSCPPADRTLEELARSSPDVIALTLPVDYWDYLGWKDTLAHGAFSARQRAYAAGRGDRQVYTPQMVVNGTLSFVGSDRAKVEHGILKATLKHGGLPVRLSLAERDGAVAIEAEGAAGVEAEVWLLPVSRAREVAIGRGENRGRTVTYTNVVRGLQRVGTWRPGLDKPQRYSVPLAAARAEGADGYVVLLQAGAGGTGRPGAILGAVKSAGL